ncbi:MAG: hypothetical protein JWO22_3570 [Frankiales bacterium]|nr:hypothetical protein [Frankiales bacterium]
MAYNPPGWFVRNVYNRLAKRFGLGQSVLLKVPGRTSGTDQQLPVTPVELDGITYLVSVRGQAQWVRNLEVSGRGTLAGKDFTAVLVDVERAKPVIAAYREKVGKAIDPIWNKLPDDADHPVFALT